MEHDGRSISVRFAAQCGGRAILPLLEAECVLVRLLHFCVGFGRCVRITPNFLKGFNFASLDGKVPIDIMDKNDVQMQVFEVESRT